MLLPSLAESLRASFGSRSRRRRTGKPPACAAHVETLENRALLSATSAFDAATGELVVQAGKTDAVVIASDLASVTLNGTPLGIAPDQVHSLVVLGGSGGNTIDLQAVTADVFVNLTSVLIDGRSGNDTIIGSGLDDVIRGGNGKDVIQGGLGNDHIEGGNGIDNLDGGEGDDWLEGGNGKDTLVGGAGNDQLWGGNGKDALDGGIGDDLLDGGRGKDSLISGLGFDLIYLDHAKDTHDAVAGEDTVFGLKLKKHNHDE
jgi:Ca2+-binding RTX toxin-like protein